MKLGIRHLISAGLVKSKLANCEPLSLGSPKLISICVYAALLTMGCSAGPAEDERQVEKKQQGEEQYHVIEVAQPNESRAIVKLAEIERAVQRQNTPAPKARMEADVSALMQMSPALSMPMVVDSSVVQRPVNISQGDNFEAFASNPVKQVKEEPLSTFSSDVDTASYSFVRRQLTKGYLPLKDAVRLEEMVNYFDYQYPQPRSASEPFKATTLVYDSPWAENRKLVHIGIQGYEVPTDAQPNSNLVFLLDVSGSMSSSDKLPLVKQSMSLLLKNLKPTDTVSIVVYAGAAGVVLPPTKVENKALILNAMEALAAGGSTAGGQGIELAYRLAEQNFDENSVNRILLATDGDFNVGLSDPEQLQDFVERKREKGIYLSVLGFGQGNYQDSLMQSLAQNGNGIAAYIDTVSEAQKVLLHEATSSLFPIADDLKIQVEFNPSVVKEYRLLGYETRELANEDFKNDKVDAGDIGSGHSVTAIYEVTLVDSNISFVDDLRYGENSEAPAALKTSELGYLKLRYKLPGEKDSSLMEQSIANTKVVSDDLLREAHFAASVAGFAQLLKDAKYTGKWTMEDALTLSLANRGEDEFGYRNEFSQLVRSASVAIIAKM